ncbi:P27 family phage terminase small subunit [Sunxiuqinia indica]|uniref:P27 family phage terminase small subunit n=1 Tax=Sunxiuqinia indica TaxID=2692584 RepID=UPI001356D823|nr:P27 family phage terminase small subunit [Sunxiuqinia indica]
MSFNKTQVESFFERLGYDLEVVEKGRKTMDALRKRFNKIKKQLKNSEIDYQDTDEMHIVTICMCEEIQMRALMDVVATGSIMYVDKDKKVKQKNHSISTFYQMSKMINDTSKKLGLSALDRKELKVEMPIEDGMPD